MTVSLKHAFTSAKSDGTDSTLVQPSNWNAEHTLTLASARLLGRTTTGTGAAEEISTGTNLSLSAGILDLASNIAISTLSTSGNVGIGTSSPGFTLDVQSANSTVINVLSSANGGGNMKMASNNVSTPVTGYVGPNAFSNNVFSMGVSSATPTIPLAFFTNSTERMRIDSSGNLLIGTTTSGNSKLYVNGSAAAAIVALTDAATIAVDMSTGNNFSVTLAGNRTLGNPTGLTAGQSGIIYVTQDATGSRTLAYSSYWKFPGGTAPTLSTAANAVDALIYTVRNSTSITVQSVLNIA